MKKEECAIDFEDDLRVEFTVIKRDGKTFVTNVRPQRTTKENTEKKTKG